MVKNKNKVHIGESNSNWKGGITIEPSGRVLVRVNQKSVYRYRLVMEEQLGRKLKKSEIVHHINGVVDDDVPENLQVMSQSEHARIHGLNCSEESRQKRKRFGKDNHWFGKHHKPETIKIFKEIARNREPTRTGAVLTKDTCNKIGESLKAFYATEEGKASRIKMTESRRNNKNKNKNSKQPTLGLL